MIGMLQIIDEYAGYAISEWYHTQQNFSKFKDVEGPYENKSRASLAGMHLNYNKNMC